MIIMINNFNVEKIPEYKQVNLKEKFHYLYFDNKDEVWLVITNQIKIFNFHDLKSALTFIGMLKGAGL